MTSSLLPLIEEEELVDALQPIRNLFLAQAIHAALDLGILGELNKTIGVSSEALASKLNLNGRRLEGFIKYLINEGFVDRNERDGLLRLTDRAQNIKKFWPWYALLVGGYTKTLLELRATLRAGGNYAARDTTSVAIGSCGISQYDALPITRHLLQKISGAWNTVVDIGCGDGSYLVDLCQSLPGAKGLGLEVDPPAANAARAAIARANLSHRVEIRVGDALSVPELANEEGPYCFVAAFVLQEVLEQSGRETLVNLLRRVRKRYPDAHWIIVEVDHQPTDAARMSTGLGLGYYNPYYLIHHLTQQRLETIGYWEELFGEVGYKLLAKNYPDEPYDSLRLKVGFLLAPMTD